MLEHSAVPPVMATLDGHPQAPDLPTDVLHLEQQPASVGEMPTLDPLFNWGDSVEEQAADCPPPDPLFRQPSTPPAEKVSVSGAGGARPTATRKAVLKRVGDYEVLGELGRGGMGVVYKARHVKLKRIVALKMILAGGHASAVDLARFRLEAEAVARIRHPNIVQIFEIGEEAGAPWFALEYIEDGSLDRRLDTPQPPRAAAALVAILARAMHAAHQAGVVHRDLKPANVLLARKADTPEAAPASTPLSAFEPKITDFGLAKELEGEGQTVSGAIMGTPSYMAPEQAAGKAIGPAADVYALCAILYESLVGRPPFKGSSVWDTLDLVQTAEPISPSRLQPKVPRDLVTICLKGLRKDPRQRYASAEALADDLERFRDGRPIQARPVSAWERALKWARRRPTQAALVAAVALLVLSGSLGGVFYGLYKGQQEHAARKEAETLKRERDRETALRDEVERLQNEGRKHEDNGQLVQARVCYEKALNDLVAEPSLAPSELRQTLDELLRNVVRQMDEAAANQDVKARIEHFADHYKEMTFRQLPVSEREAPANRKRVRQEAEAALSAFDLVKAGKPDSVVAGLEGRRQTLETLGQFERICEQSCLVLIAWADAEVAETDPAAPQRALQLLREAAGLVEAGHLPMPRGLPELRARCYDRLGEADKAQAERKQLQLLVARTAEDHYRAAAADFHQARFPQAATGCEQVLDLEPDHLGARYLLALSRLRSPVDGDRLLRLRGLEVARASLTDCIKHRPDFLWARLVRGSVYAELREFDKAEADFASVLAAAASDEAFCAEVLTNRGASRLQQNRVDVAVADLKEAVRLQPKAYQGYASLAVAQQKDGDLGAALKALDRAVELAPDNALLRYSRGRLHFECYQLTEAWGRKLKLRLLQDTLAQAALDHAAWTRKDLEAYLAAETGTHPDRVARARTDLAILHHEAGEFAAALKQCDDALRVRSTAKPLFRKPELLLALNRNDEADKALKHFLDKDKPDARDATGWTARGLIHAHAGNHREALEAYNHAVRLNPDARNQTLRGWTFLALDSPRLALIDFDAALKLQPTSSDARCGRGHALAMMGNTAQAQDDAVAAYHQGPRTPTLLANLACICARCADRPETPLSERRACQELGLKFLRGALDLVPEGEQGDFWRKRVQTEPVLAPLRGSPGMRELERLYSMK